uniref:Uncharacterized protein n=1 Tax=Glossina austeni TaxID=7395 RepID=A0A1A9VX57_GLOAU
MAFFSLIFRNVASSFSASNVWKQECKHTKNGDLPDKASTLFSVIGNSISSVCMITSLRSTLTAYISSVPRRSANNILPYEPLPKTLIKLKSPARIISRLLILCVKLVSPAISARFLGTAAAAGAAAAGAAAIF